MTDTTWYRIILTLLEADLEQTTRKRDQIVEAVKVVRKVLAKFEAQNLKEKGPAPCKS